MANNFRLNARKPKNNAGLATPKGEIYLLYREDIIAMPEKDKRGVLTTGDIIIKEGRRFHLLYTTPATQIHNRDTEGDVDSRGWKKKISGNYPGDELEINEFVKNNLNQGFIAVVKSCQSEFMKIYGSVNNPLYFTGSFVDDNERKGYELTFEQTFADEDPVLFYSGKILVDEDAFSESDPEFSSLFVKLDGSNITDENKEILKKKLDIGNLPPNIATIDKDNKVGNVYSKIESDANYLPKTTATISEPNAEFKYVYLTNEANQTRRMLAGDLGKNVANSKPTSVAGAGLNMGAIWDIDTNGFPLRIKGLPDKSADSTFNKMRVQDENGVDAWSNGKPVMENLMASLPDATGDANAFNIYPVYNAVTNKLAKSVRPQVITNFNVPANIQITHSVNSPGVVINPKPEYSEDLKNALNKIKEISNLGFTKIKTNELVVKLLEEQFFPDQAKGKYSFPTNLIEIPEDGCFIFNGFGNLVNYVTHFTSIQHTNYLDSNNAKAFYNVFINKEMPSDRDWIVKLRTHSNGNSYSTGNKGHSIGLRSDITTYADFDFNSTFVKFGGSGAIDTSTLFTKATSIFGISLFTEIYFIKQGSLIITLVLDIQANRYTMEVNAYEETYKKLYFYINPNYYGIQQGQVIFKDISYWIQN